jgi:hypothetical protein
METIFSYVAIVDGEEFEIREMCAKSAAEEAARQYDEEFGAWSVARGGRIEVVVEDEDGATTTWGVLGRLVPVYGSRRVE